MTSLQTLSWAALEDLISRALQASNVSADNAACVARALTAAEADGQKGHGLSRVPSYAAQARTGKVDGHAVPMVHASRAGSLVIDARHGFAYPALDLALARLPGMARSNGIAAAAITRSHHFGVAAHPCEHLAGEGLVALVFGNTPSAMSAWGGRRAVFGTNPIAFAAPCRDRPPIVVDLALSEVARGKIVAAAQAGRPIPLGWAVDAQGQPTTDAKEALKGTLLPTGGAKGAALALMVEVLAAALTGANFAFEASSFFDSEGSPPSVGQFLIAIDPAAFSTGAHFVDRVALLAATIGQDDSARIPGTRRFAERERARREGFKIDDSIYQDVKSLAG
jgi:(2R)-3-sulfolactate dehydrogenase (NADP+)